MGKDKKKKNKKKQGVKKGQAEAKEPKSPLNQEINPLLTAQGALQQQKQFEAGSLSSLLAQERLISLKEQLERRQSMQSFDSGESYERQNRFSRKKHFDAPQDLIFQDIEKELAYPEPPSNQTNYDYLMSLFDQYGGKEEQKRSFQDQRTQNQSATVETLPSRSANFLSNIDEHQRATNQRVKSYIEKLSSSRSPSGGAKSGLSSDSKDHKSSSSSAAAYLQSLMQKRDLQKQTQEDTLKMKGVDIPPLKGGVLSSMKSTTQNTQSNSVWHVQQQEELNSMRERYLNMSGMELESLTPADMLNITYEYNRKQAIMQQLFSKQKDSTAKLDLGSSSSSSLRNDAGFNIFEEICQDQFRANDSDERAKGDKIKRSESKLTMINDENPFEEKKVEVANDFPGSKSDSLSEKLMYSNNIDSRIVDHVIQTRRRRSKSNTSSEKSVVAKQTPLYISHFENSADGAQENKPDFSRGLSQGRTASDPNLDILHLDPENSLPRPTSSESSDNSTPSKNNTQILDNIDPPQEQLQPVQKSILKTAEVSGLNSSKSFEIFKDEKIEQHIIKKEQSIDTDPNPDFNKQEFLILDRSLGRCDDTPKNDLQNTQTFDRCEDVMQYQPQQFMEQKINILFSGDTPKSRQQNQPGISKGPTISLRPSKTPGFSQQIMPMTSRFFKSGALDDQQPLMSEQLAGNLSQRQILNQLEGNFESSNHSSVKTKNIKNRYQIMKIGQQKNILQQSSISNITYRSQSHFQSSLQNGNETAAGRAANQPYSVPQKFDQTFCFLCFKDFEFQDQRKPVLLLCQDLICQPCLKQQIRTQVGNTQCPICEEKIEITLKEDNSVRLQSCGIQLEYHGEEATVSEQVLALLPVCQSSMFEHSESRANLNQSTLQLSAFDTGNDKVPFSNSEKKEEDRIVQYNSIKQGILHADEDETLKSEQVRIQIQQMTSEKSSFIDVKTEEGPEEAQTVKQSCQDGPIQKKKLTIFESRLDQMAELKKTAQVAEDELQKTLSLSDQFQGFTMLDMIDRRKSKKYPRNQSGHKGALHRLKPLDDSQNTLTAKEEIVGDTPKIEQQDGSIDYMAADNFFPILPHREQMIPFPDDTLSQKKRKRMQRQQKVALKKKMQVNQFSQSQGSRKSRKGSDVSEDTQRTQQREQILEETQGITGNINQRQWSADSSLKRRDDTEEKVKCPSSLNSQELSSPGPLQESSQLTNSYASGPQKLKKSSGSQQQLECCSSLKLSNESLGQKIREGSRGTSNTTQSQKNKKKTLTFAQKLKKELENSKDKKSSSCDYSKSSSSLSRLLDLDDQHEQSSSFVLDQFFQIQRDKSDNEKYDRDFHQKLYSIMGIDPKQDEQEFDPLKLLNYSYEPELDDHAFRQFQPRLVSDPMTEEQQLTVEQELKRKKRKRHFQHLMQIQKIIEKEKFMDEQFNQPLSLSPAPSKDFEEEKQQLETLPIEELLYLSANRPDKASDYITTMPSGFKRFEDVSLPMFIKPQPFALEKFPAPIRRLRFNKTWKKLLKKVRGHPTKQWAVPGQREATAHYQRRQKTVTWLAKLEMT